MKRPRESLFTPLTLQAFAATGLPLLFGFRAAQDDKPAEILLYDEIGPWGVTAKDFAGAMAQAGAGDITVRVNSPGGSVFDGLAIYNALKAHPGAVNVVVDGLAASAASFIAMAGDTVSMAESSMMMIHNASAVVMGNRNDLRDTANVLDKVDAQMADIYAAKTGKPADEISGMMDAETWMTAAEAKDAGFCDALCAAPDKKTAKVDDSVVQAAAQRTRIALRARIAMAR